jgi:hypothetical protein
MNIMLQIADLSGEQPQPVCYNYMAAVVAHNSSNVLVLAQTLSAEGQ